MAKNLKIGARLGFAFALLTLLSLTLGAITTCEMHAMHTQWQLIKQDAIAKQDSTARAIAALEDDIHHFKNFILRGADYDKRFSVDVDAAGRTAADYKATGAVSTDEEKLTAKLLLAMAFFTPHPGQEAIVMVRKAAPKAAPVLKGAEKRLGVSAFAFAEARDEAQFTRF